MGIETAVAIAVATAGSLKLAQDVKAEKDKDKEEEQQEEQEKTQRSHVRRMRKNREFAKALQLSGGKPEALGSQGPAAGSTMLGGRP